MVVALFAVMWSLKIIPWYQPKAPASVPSSGQGPSPAPVPKSATISLQSLGGFCASNSPSPAAANCVVGKNGFEGSGPCVSGAPSPNVSVGSVSTFVSVNGVPVLSVADGGVQITTLQGGVQTPYSWDPTIYATDCASWQLGSWIGSVLVNADANGNLSCEYAVFNASNPGGPNRVPPGFFGQGVFQNWSEANPTNGDGSNFLSWVTYALTGTPPSPAVKRVALLVVLSGTAGQLSPNSYYKTYGPIMTQALQTLASLACTALPQNCPATNAPVTLWPTVGENFGYCAIFDFATARFIEAVPKTADTVVSLNATIPY